MLLQHLDSMGYSELYPRLRVAMQRLQQQFPWIEEEVSSSQAAAAGLSQLRQIRDLALQHWEKEKDVVRRILERSDACMRILVPRFGEDAPAVEETPPLVRTENIAATDGENDDDDDDDIAWEDGFEEEENADTVESEQPEESHAEAVERTLAVMQSSARMQAGQLEISFDATTEEQTTITPQMMESKRKLEKFVERLRHRHVERLNTWIDALTRADSLMQGEGGSLVRMTAESRQRRRETLQNALQLKADISSCLSSAKRLVSSSTQMEMESTHGTSLQRPGASLNIQSATRNERLATALNRRRPQMLDHTRKRSAKIRIKYSK